MIYVFLEGDDLVYEPGRVTGFLTPAEARLFAAELLRRADEQDSHQSVKDESTDEP